MMHRIKIILSSLLLVGLLGCSKSKKEQAQVQPSSQPTTVAQNVLRDSSSKATRINTESAPAARTAVKPSRIGSSRQAAPEIQQESKIAEAAAPVVRPEAVTEAGSTPSPQTQGTHADEPVASPPAPSRSLTAALPAGTMIDVRLAQALSSAEDRSGDRFEAILERDLEIDGLVVAPRGSTVVGRLLDVVESGKVQGLAQMSLTLIEIRVGVQSYPIKTSTISFEAGSTKGRDAKAIAGSAGLGAIIGAIAGGKKGAAIGATIGGGAGVAGVMTAKGKEVELQREHRFTFRLVQELAMKIRQ